MYWQLRSILCASYNPRTVSIGKKLFSASDLCLYTAPNRKLTIFDSYSALNKDPRLYEGSCALENTNIRTVLNFKNGPRVLRALFLLRGIHL